MMSNNPLLELLQRLEENYKKAAAECDAALSGADMLRYRDALRRKLSAAEALLSYARSVEGAAQSADERHTVHGVVACTAQVVRAIKEGIASLDGTVTALATNGRFYGEA